MQSVDRSLNQISGPDADAGANEALMRRFIEEVINRGNYDVLDELVHPAYRYSASGETLRGPAAIRAAFEAYRAALPDLHIRIDRLVGSGALVAIAFTLTGTHEGELMGVAATGKPVSINGMVFSQIEAGRIVEEWEVLDQLSMLHQLQAVGAIAQTTAA